MGETGEQFLINMLNIVAKARKNFGCTYELIVPF